MFGSVLCLGQSINIFFGNSNFRRFVIINLGNIPNNGKKCKWDKIATAPDIQFMITCWNLQYSLITNHLNCLPNSELRNGVHWIHLRFGSLTNLSVRLFGWFGEQQISKSERPPHLRFVTLTIKRFRMSFYKTHFDQPVLKLSKGAFSANILNKRDARVKITRVFSS